jgi:hypothetical protein
MSFAKRGLPLLGLLAASLCTPAQAADYEVGTSIVCDTQTQVERFFMLFAEDAQSAIDTVNAEEHNPTGCALANVAYVRGSRIEVVRQGNSAFEIVRILVVGIDTAAGIQAVQPAAYFSQRGAWLYSLTITAPSPFTPRKESSSGERRGAARAPLYSAPVMWAFMEACERAML